MSGPGPAVAKRKRTVGGSPVDVLDLERWLPYRCWVVASRVSACLERMYGERYGMSVTGWRVMAVLGRYQPLSAKSVAERAAMDPVQMTRAINHMVTIGLVTRRSDSRDRRRAVLRLSAKGIQAYGRIVPLARGIEHALLAGLSPAERQCLDAASDRLYRQAEELLGGEVDWRRFG